MPHLLRLDASADPRTSASRAVTAAFVAAWQGRGADLTVTSRDLHADPPPHLPDALLHWAPELRTSGEVADPAADARQQGHLDELLAADVLLIGMTVDVVTVQLTLAGRVAPLADRQDEAAAGAAAARDRAVELAGSLAG